MGVINFLGIRGFNINTTQELVDDLSFAVGEYQYNVVSNLVDCSSDNTRTTATANAPYTANITADAGYKLTGASVTITMGGVDITSTAYNDGVISIASVTGDISIDITAVLE